MAFLSAFYILVFWWRKWPWKVLWVTLVVGC